MRMRWAEGRTGAWRDVSDGRRRCRIAVGRDRLDRRRRCCQVERQPSKRTDLWRSVAAAYEVSVTVATATALYF